MTGGAATLRCRAAITAGSIRRARAQASSSAGVLQQQFEKHCSAVAQPQGLSMQGNVVDLSLPARRLDAAASTAAGLPPSGSGRPEATRQ